MASIRYARPEGAQLHRLGGPVLKGPALELFLKPFAQRQRHIMDRTKVREIFVRAKPRRLAELVLLACFLGGFIVLASEMSEGETRPFDDWVLLHLRNASELSLPVGGSWLQGPVSDITALGSATVLTITTTIVVIALALIGRRLESLVTTVSIVLACATNYGLKVLYARPRPSVVPHLVAVSSESFPSGHSMMSAVVFLTVGSLLAFQTDQRKLKVYVLTTAVALTILVGLSRIY